VRPRRNRRMQRRPLAKRNRHHRSAFVGRGASTGFLFDDPPTSQLYTLSLHDALPICMTPFKNTKGTVGEGGFRVPALIRWPGRVKPGTVENGLFSGLDWFPTLLAAAGNPNITDQLLNGVKLGDRTYKNHLDGYNQMDL